MKKHLTLILAMALGLSLMATGCAPAPSAPAEKPAEKPAAEAPVKKVGTAPNGDEVAIEKAAVKLVSAVNAGGYKLITAEELKKAVDAKEQMIIIDTMPADFFAKGHIPGAVNAELPKEGMDKVTADQKAAFTKLLGEDKTKKVVVYCGFTACGRSDNGAVIAKELGFTEVYRFAGGIIAWQDAKYETEK